jgi:hypothetical protein
VVEGEQVVSAEIITAVANNALEAQRVAKLKREAEERAEAEVRYKYSCNVAFPYFYKRFVGTLIKKAASQGKFQASVYTRDSVVADLAVKKLVSEGYKAWVTDEYVEANYEYGSSGEGMHDAYTNYRVNIEWGGK